MEGAAVSKDSWIRSLGRAVNPSATRFSINGHDHDIVHGGKGHPSIRFLSNTLARNHGVVLLLELLLGMPAGGTFAKPNPVPQESRRGRAQSPQGRAPFLSL